MKLLVAGAGGHGRVVADLAAALGIFSTVEFLDDALPLGELPGGYRIIGRTASLNVATDNQYRFIAAVGDARSRMTLLETALAAGVNVTTLVHPKACVSTRADLGSGTVVCAGAVIVTGAVLGRGCIVNTCASVDHDCVLEDAVHVCPGAHLAGSCRVGSRTWLGVGSSVRDGVEICADVMIGAGAAVTANISTPGLYVGVPAERRQDGSQS
jgi:sugar O-acyltransferase (sialic acid O-acetyltransferase NeuD family)